jgi:hypothetical protein
MATPSLEGVGFVEFFLLALLAFIAAFRGWGFWAFLLLAVPFAPDLVDVGWD